MCNMNSADSILTHFKKYKDMSINIDITRGKPEGLQLDISNELLSLKVDPITESGIDLRNYGEPLGIEEARELGSQILGAPSKNIIAAEQSSLLLTYQTFLSYYLFSDDPWKKRKSKKFIYPVPGFDRHFRILEDFDIEVITVPLKDDGVDIEEYTKILEENNDVCGILSVPRHSNPSGETFSDENIKKIFKIGKEYSDNFLFIFDHAYLVHDFLPTIKQTPIWSIATTEKVTDNCVVATSFSKVTFGGGGLSFIVSGGRSFNLIKRMRESMIICPDKINQKRHVMFLKDIDNITNHMKKHAELILPKFEVVKKILSDIPLECGTFSNPTGGYFMTYNFNKPIATKVQTICEEMGLYITPASSLFPKGKCPDNVLRIAPTYVSVNKLELAMNIFITAVQIAHFDIEY